MKFKSSEFFQARVTLILAPGRSNRTHLLDFTRIVVEKLLRVWCFWFAKVFVKTCGARAIGEKLLRRPTRGRPLRIQQGQIHLLRAMTWLLGFVVDAL